MRRSNEGNPSYMFDYDMLCFDPFDVNMKVIGWDVANWPTRLWGTWIWSPNRGRKSHLVKYMSWFLTPKEYGKWVLILYLGLGST